MLQQLTNNKDKIDMSEKRSSNPVNTEKNIIQHQSGIYPSPAPSTDYFYLRYSINGTIVLIRELLNSMFVS